MKIEGANYAIGRPSLASTALTALVCEYTRYLETLGHRIDG